MNAVYTAWDQAVWEWDNTKFANPRSWSINIHINSIIIAIYNAE